MEECITSSASNVASSDDDDEYVMDGDEITRKSNIVSNFDDRFYIKWYTEYVAMHRLMIKYTDIRFWTNERFHKFHDRINNFIYARKADEMFKTWRMESDSNKYYSGSSCQEKNHRLEGLIVRMNIQRMEYIFRCSTAEKFEYETIIKYNQRFENLLRYAVKRGFIEVNGSILCVIRDEYSRYIWNISHHNYDNMEYLIQKRMNAMIFNNHHGIKNTIMWKSNIKQIQKNTIYDEEMKFVDNDDGEGIYEQECLQEDDLEEIEWKEIKLEFCVLLIAVILFVVWVSV